MKKDDGAYDHLDVLAFAIVSAKKQLSKQEKKKLIAILQKTPLSLGNMEDAEVILNEHIERKTELLEIEGLINKGFYKAVFDHVSLDIVIYDIINREQCRITKGEIPKINIEDENSRRSIRKYLIEHKLINEESLLSYDFESFDIQ